MALTADDALNGGNKANAALNGGYGSVASVKGAYKQAQDALGKEDKAMQPALERGRAAANQPMPEVPEPKKAGPAPDLRTIQKDSEGWLTAISALAAFVGSRGRMGGTGALKAFAAGSKGLQEGNKQAFDAATTKWKEDTEAMLKENDQEMRKYDAILKNRELSEHEAMNEIKMVAAEYQNQTMMAMDNYHQAAAAYDSRQKLTLQADLAYKKMDAHEKMLQEREDKKDALIAKNLKNFDSMKDTDIVPGLSATKADILNKIKTLHDTGGNYAAAGISTRTMNNPIKDMVESVKAQIYPNEQTSEMRAQFAGEQQFQRSLATRSAPAVAATKEMDHLAQPMVHAVSNLDPTSYPDLNSLRNAYDKKTGGPDVVRAFQAVQAYKTAYVGLLTKNGVPTDQARSKSDELFGEDMSLPQIEGAVLQSKIEGAAVIDGLQEAKGGFSGAPSGAKPTAGKSKTIGGVTYTQDENGDWHHD